MRMLLAGSVLLLIGGCGVWYVIAVRAWIRRLGQPDVRELDERGRAAFMATPEYARLRGAVRRPMMAAAILFGLLYAILRFIP